MQAAEAAVGRINARTRVQTASTVLLTIIFISSSIFLFFLCPVSSGRVGSSGYAMVTLPYGQNFESKNVTVPPLAGGCDVLCFVSRYKLLVRLPLERRRFCFSMSCLRSRSARARWTVRGESPNSRAMVLIPGQQTPEASARSRR